MGRNTDILTNEKCMQELAVYESVPVFFGTTNDSKDLDLMTEMRWEISTQTGMIQLKNLVDLEHLYQHQTTTTAIGKTWQQHHESFARYVNDRRRSNAILEIGGAHGILAKNCMQYDDKIKWIIVEPNPAPVEGCMAEIIKDFYPTQKINVSKFQTFVHSHVLEHIYKPMEFLRSVHESMTDDSQMIFSIPDLTHWLKNKYLNALNFEHSYFAREEYVDWMLESSGFKIIDKTYYGEGHSIFYDAIKTRPIEVKPPNFFHENKEIWHEFIEFYNSKIPEITKKVNRSQNNYLFGAHIFSQHLINIGLDQRYFKYVIDNDPKKQDQRLYGTDLLVKSPDIIRDIESPIVILNAGRYNEEISEQLIRINESVIIVD